jgi:hypothetical protein
MSRFVTSNKNLLVSDVKYITIEAPIFFNDF